MPSDKLNAVIGELIKSAADVVYTLAVADKPVIELSETGDLTGEAISKYLSKEFAFSATLSGIDNARVIVIFPGDLAQHLAGSLMGTGESESFGSAEKSAVFELMSNILTNWAGILSEKLSIELTGSDKEIYDPDSLSIDLDEKWYQVVSSVTIKEEKFSLSVFLSSEITIPMEENVEKETGTEETTEPEAVEETSAESKKPEEEKSPDPVESNEPEESTAPEEPEAPGPKGDMGKDDKAEEPEDRINTKVDENVNIRQTQFQQLQQELAEDQVPLTERPIELILDVPLPISVELGRKDLTIREILELSPGSLIELNQLGDGSKISPGMVLKIKPKG